MSSEGSHLKVYGTVVEPFLTQFAKIEQWGNDEASKVFKAFRSCEERSARARMETADCVRFSGRDIDELPFSMSYFPATKDLIVREEDEYGSGIHKTMRRVLHFYPDGTEKLEAELRVRRKLRNGKVCKYVDRVVDDVVKEEMELLSKFNHPNILPKPLRSWSNLEGKMTYLFPFYSTTLLDVFSDTSKTRLEQSEIFLTHFLQVLEGIKYLHGEGYVHGDIRWDHVMLDGDTPVLIDFGFAKPAADGSEDWSRIRELFGDKIDLSDDDVKQLGEANSYEAFKKLAEDIRSRLVWHLSLELNWPLSSSCFK